MLLGSLIALQRQGFSGLIILSEWRTLRSVRESVLENSSKSLLPTRNPLRVVFPNHFLGVADQFGDICHRYAPFEQYAGERVAESVGTRFRFERPGELEYQL